MHRTATGLGTGLATALLTLAGIGMAAAQPVTGPYVSLGGGGNLSQDQAVRLNQSFPAGKLRFDVGYAAAGAVGYGFGNGFRVEVEGNWRRNDLQRYRGTTFPTTVGGSEDNYGALGNLIFDMDIGSPFVYPYFGAGAGYAWSHLDRFRVTAADGSYDFTAGGTQGHFAYQGLFGLSFPVPWVRGLSLTAEYRFFSVVGNTAFNGQSLGTRGAFGDKPFGLAQGNFDTRTNYNHSGMIGVRYELFPPAPRGC